MAMSIKTYKYYIVPILSMLTLSACKDFDDSITNLSEGKTPIELSVGDDSSPITRAVVIDGRGKITAFENDTRLHLLMISHDKTKAKTATSTDKYTETYGEAKGSGTSVPNLNEDPTQWSDAQKESAVSFESGKGVYRYWDDAHGRESLLSIYGFANVWAIQPTGSPWYPRLDRTAAPGTETGTETNNFPATWGTPNAAMGTFVGGSVDATYNPTGKWIVGDFTPNNNKKYQEQTKTSILSKDDICYSNNLADYSDNTSLPEAERTDNRPHFEASTTPKHFTGGTMVFHRAMCLFTFKVYMGGGFSESDFKFKDGTNIAMKGFNKKGFLNIKNGEWTESSIEEGTDATYEGVTGYSWSKIDLTNEDKTDKSMDTDTGGKYWQLLAFAIPGTDISTSTIADALTMNINGNVYKVSMKQLYDAIVANGANCESGTPNGTVKSDYLTDGTKLKAGINYEFSFTIGKTAINKITAKVVDWETVTADDITPTNARITLDLLDTGDAQSAGVDFYRGLNYNDATDINDNWSSYTWQPIQYEKADADYTDGHWTTKWVWESNRHFYNFRAIMPANHAINGNSEAPYNPKFALSAGPSGTYTDVKWGAPFKNTTNKLTYSTSKGFDGKAAETTDNHQIYKAIGPTNSPIKLISFHMMSEVEINLATTADTDPTHINFGDGTATVTKIKLNGCTQTGTVNLGDGCVTPGTTKEAVFLSETLSNSNKKLTYGVVPQSLEGAELRITTADGNEYLVDLASVVINATAANPTNNNIANPYDVVDGKCTINYWYPGFKYIYNLTLTKKGIADLKATIVDWETVTVDQGGITIK